MMVYKALRFTAYRMIGVLFVCGGLGWCETAQEPPETSATVAESSVPVRVPFHYPLAVKTLKVLSGYGKRTLPPSLLAAATTQAEIKFYEKAHEGIDIAGTQGMSVLAARRGKVLFAGFSKTYVSRKNKNEQHRLIILSHPDGLSTRYVHLATLKVRPQQEVESGQMIGALSDSDEWSQPVLHFEVRDQRGQPLDPLKTMAEFAVPVSSVTP